MEQKSNVQYRAEKEYKNSREKFFLLLREVISNAIHAVIIRKLKDDSIIPSISLDIVLKENECRICITDNGEGFTKQNRECFEALDKINSEKERYKFHPLGQGRLAIVFFADSANYETVYKDEDGIYWKQDIPYPNVSDGLFELEGFSKEKVEAKDTYTKLSLIINKPHTFGRAHTFFKTRSDINALKLWVIETFFPFLIQNETLSISLTFNGESATITRKNIETEIEQATFELDLAEKKYAFSIWLIRSCSPMKGENLITCFARNLKAELSNSKLSYQLDNETGYKLYLTSDLFDECVDTKGEHIEISNSDISDIQTKINETLDKKFADVITQNKRQSKRNLRTFRQKYPSLEVFVESDALSKEKSIVSEADIVRRAVEEKSRIEKKFWTFIDQDSTDGSQSRYNDSEECQKLLNSSLHIYVRHRERVLKQLHSLLPLFNEDGDSKPELENTVHELFFKRGTTLEQSSYINHLHNLWIIDDKFTTFSNNFKAKSTKNGQSVTDIYIWADDPEKTRQVLLIEIKSTTKAHNAGDKYEGMIAQIHRYVRSFYNNPTKHLNWDVDTDKVQYTAIILARKSDIEKELMSTSVGGSYTPIPFLENSYYLDDFFPKTSPKDKMPIRIELYSFEDIYYLASSRNNVFFRLLKNEFEIDSDVDNIV